METIIVKTPDCNIFVSDFNEQSVWINFMSSHSSKATEMTVEKARELISAIEEAIKFLETNNEQASNA